MDEERSRAGGDAGSAESCESVHRARAGKPGRTLRLPELRFEAALPAELAQKAGRLLRESGAGAETRRREPGLTHMSHRAAVKFCGPFKRVVIFLLLAVTLPVTAAPAPEGQDAGNKGLLRFEESVDTMGTTITVVVYGQDRFRLQSAVETSLEEARRLEELLSNYRPESEWSQLNRSAGEKPVRVPKELFDLLGPA